MTVPTPRAWLAPPLSALAIVLAVAVIVLGWGRPAAGDLPVFSAILVLQMVPFLAYALVGGLVATRRSSNPMGWLLLLIGVAMTAQVTLEEYAVQAIVLRPGSLPAATAVDWIAEWLWIVPLTAIQFTPLLFPDGHLPSRRWRWFAGAVLVGDIVVAVALPIVLWPLRGTISMDDSTFAEAGAGALLDPLIGLLVLAVPISLLSLVVRYRRADAVQRHQLRWLAFAAVLLAAGLAASSLLTGPLGVTQDWGALPALVGSSALPVALAYAVLRRDLFDLGRIVSRTLAYLVLTGVLVGIYALGVLGVGALLPGEPSDLLVAGSTLVVAALFRPLRSRIQAVVDRRFNRSRYDAARTIEAFGARLRDEVDLGSLDTELRGAVAATVQPRAASLWLRDGSP